MSFSLSRMLKGGTSRLPAKLAGVLVLVVGTLFLSLTVVNADPNAPNATVGDRVFRDNRFTPNGIQNAGEPGLPFAPINLWNVAGTDLISVVNADINGNYNMVGIAPASYLLEAPNPSANSGFLYTLQDVGADTTDSDVDGANAATGSGPSSASGGSATVTIPGAGTTDLDVGYYQNANRITYCDGQQLTFTDFTTSIDLPQSNPINGVLTDIDIRISTGVLQNGQINNLETTTQVFDYAGGVSTQVTPTLGVVQTTLANEFVDNISIPGGGTFTIPELVAYNFRDYDVPTANFAAYEGLGTVNFPARARGTSTFTGGGNLQAVVQTRAYVTVCITYQYTILLAVDLATFEAVCRPTDVRVAWETTNEANNLGFNLYRAASADGDPERLNSELIASQAPGGGGAAYEWLDTTMPGNGVYYYWLEAVDASGEATRYGPTSAAYPCEATAVTLSDLTAQGGMGGALVPFLAAGLLLLAAVGIVARKR